MRAKIILWIIAFCFLVFWFVPTRETLKQKIVKNNTDNKLLYKITAYCPCKKCCGKYADGITASGHKIQYNDKLCAANFPFHTILDIPGYGIAPVLDRGGLIKERCIDVLFYEKSQDPNLTDLERSHQTALEWGVQYLEVKILK